jgi:hypothetical protein
MRFNELSSGATESLAVGSLGEDESGFGSELGYVEIYEKNLSLEESSRIQRS